MPQLEKSLSSFLWHSDLNVSREYFLRCFLSATTQRFVANNPFLKLLMTRVLYSGPCLFGFVLTLLFVLFVSLSLDYHCLSMHSCLKTSTPGDYLHPRWTLVYDKKAYEWDAYCPLFTVWWWSRLILQYHQIYNTNLLVIYSFLIYAISDRNESNIVKLCTIFSPSQKPNSPVGTGDKMICLIFDCSKIWSKYGNTWSVVNFWTVVVVTSIWVVHLLKDPANKFCWD